MLEAVRTLANVSPYSLKELRDISREFGDDCLVACQIPVGVLIRAHMEYANLKRPEDAVTTCARVVAAAEAVVDAGSPVALVGDFRAEYLALCREIDNLRSYSHA
jgi:hypothetical protein